ncbi:hypothetical protein HY522_01440 [bacterium]|nr:hypothetical protein [bacterium]
MQTAARMSILATLIAGAIGLAVILVRNDYRLPDMFQSYRSVNLSTNANYYPHVGGSSPRPVSERFDPSEGY